MSIFDHADFSSLEQVIFASDPASGLKAVIIVLHNNCRRPALGRLRAARSPPGHAQPCSNSVLTRTAMLRGTIFKPRASKCVRVKAAPNSRISEE